MRDFCLPDSIFVFIARFSHKILGLFVNNIIEQNERSYIMHNDDDKKTMKEKLHDTAELVEEKACELKEDIKEGAEKLKEKAHEAKEKLDEKLAEHKDKDKKDDA